MRLPAIAAVLLAACGSGRAVDGNHAAAMFDRVTVDTGGVHGLSGLAAEDGGALWMVAERGKMLFRVELDGTTVRSITHHPIDIPDGEDLESLSWDGGRLWAGLEKGASLARVVHLLRDGDRFKVHETDVALIRSEEAGVSIGKNHGVEGLCIANPYFVAAIETTGTDERGRWAPLVVIDQVAHRTVHRLRLTSATGKISALDCRRRGELIEVLAIERHFEITRVLTFTLDPAAPPSDITPHLALDASPAIRGALNLEGIVWGPGDHPIAVVDNQYGGITGPDELLVFKAPLR